MRRCTSPCEGNALQKSSIDSAHVRRLRPVLAGFVLGFPGRYRGGRRGVRQPIARDHECERANICAAKNLFNAYAPLEQLTLNQRVQGSSPCAPTKPINVLGQDRAPTVKSGGTIWGTALGGQPWPLVGHTVSGQFPTRRGCAPVVAPGARIARRSPRGEPTGNV